MRNGLRVGEAGQRGGQQPGDRGCDHAPDDEPRPLGHEAAMRADGDTEAISCKP